MSNSGRMNQFLQRMLKKTEEEDKSVGMGHFERSKTRKSSRRYVSRSTNDGSKSSGIFRKNSFSRPAWMRKLGRSCDQTTQPIEIEIPKSPIIPKSEKTLYMPTHENTGFRKASCRKAKTLPTTLNESQEIEHIVQEFESNFKSPTSTLSQGSGNFVKKIVAAFEDKYKSYNDSWSGKVRDKLKGSGRLRKSYTDICQSLNLTSVEIPQNNADSSQDYQSSQGRRRSQSITEDSGKAGEQPGPSITQVISQDQTTSFPKFESQDPKSPNNQESSKSKDGAPFIIGAFLKKPIKIDQTCINWIPFPGNKLPRKKSLKKLLTKLTRKKSSEVTEEVVFASQINVWEETRELPDSGYDEQSASSSSLASLARSTPEIPIQKDAIYANQRNSTRLNTFNVISTNLSTFHARPHKQEDTESEIYKAPSKKLLLYEVPREELKADLGPCYPKPSTITVKSLDRRVTSREKIYLPPLPKHPAKSTIPKHPFISLSKDELNEPDDKEDFQIRKTLTNFSSFQPSNCQYDVPKSFFSKSEPGIVEMLKFTFHNNLPETSHYDVPRLRPKSSVYDDALSLKRRNADLGDNSFASTSSHEYYSSPCSDKSNQYATIGSRNRRYLNPDVCRSSNELASNSVIVTVL